MVEVRETTELLSGFRDNAQKPAMEALERGDAEKAVRAFVDGFMGKQNVFDQIPEQTRRIMIDNAESLQGELESGMHASFTVEDVKQISISTLLVKGELSPRFFHRIVDFLITCQIMNRLLFLVLLTTLVA
jgi:hypothetical protein